MDKASLTPLSSQVFPPFCQNNKDLTTIPFWYHNQVFKNRIQFSNALNINALLIFLILLVRLNKMSFSMLILINFAYGLVEFIYVNRETHRIIKLYADVDQLNYRLHVHHNLYWLHIFRESDGKRLFLRHEYL